MSILEPGQELWLVKCTDTAKFGRVYIGAIRWFTCRELARRHFSGVEDEFLQFEELPPGTAPSPGIPIIQSRQLGNAANNTLERQWKYISDETWMHL